MRNLCGFPTLCVKKTHEKDTTQPGRGYHKGAPMKSNKPYTGKPTICIDFDGVIHSYVQPWQGPHVIPDPPVEGALEWLCSLVASHKFVVCIYSSRSKYWRGRRAMRRWLREHYMALALEDEPCPKWLVTWIVGHNYNETWELDVEETVKQLIRQIKFPVKKPAATLTIDDRAYRFDGPGTFPTIDGILTFKPWNKRGI